MNLRILPLELLLGLLLLGNALEAHANGRLAILLEVEERIRVLQLVEVPLNVLVIVHVLFELGPPLAALLVVHKLFAVKIVKQYSYLGVLLVAEVKP